MLGARIDNNPIQADNAPWVASYERGLLMKRSKQNPSSPEAEDTSRRRNRRQALALGGAAAAAAAVAALGANGGKKARAATGDNMKVGQANWADAGDGTEVIADVEGGSAFHVENPAAVGTAIHGEAPGGAGGLLGSSTGAGPGVHGSSVKAVAAPA